MKSEHNVKNHPGLQLWETRKDLPRPSPTHRLVKGEEEGGCGVTGFAASVPVSGKHIFLPSIQMHNRGNGKGGGIAAVGLEAASLGVTQELLDEDYLIQVAYLDQEVRPQVERDFITKVFRVDHMARVPTLQDWRDLPGLMVQPPEVWRYFVRVKPEVLQYFVHQHRLYEIPLNLVEDEFVAQNCYRLNQAFYASLGEKKAFVLSQGKNIMILKIVGYAEEAALYYQLLDVKAHVWIAHQRYPTRGRVWHPGGAHPFAALNVALVHNGDFANYFAVSEYLSQRHFYPQFLTDTEVAVLLFDLWHRLYGYPLEYVIESLAPTTERDFDLLPPKKQRVYRQLQAANIHGSPDGPWFFIIARNDTAKRRFELIGITDTSMLRPQVFALQEGQVQIGLVCSEKQAIDATLASLAQEDPRFCPVADIYWNARGGSHTDGGAFIFSLARQNGRMVLSCHDKFGKPKTVPWYQQPWEGFVPEIALERLEELNAQVRELLADASGQALLDHVVNHLPQWTYARFLELLHSVEVLAQETDDLKAAAIAGLTLLIDRRFDPGEKKRSHLLSLTLDSLYRIFAAVPLLGKKDRSRYRRLDWQNRGQLKPPHRKDAVLVLNASEFPPEGEDCDARFLCQAYELGWRRFIGYGYRGQRFLGCGLGLNTEGVRIDAYGSTGDYLASGIDGLEIYVHGNAQDQLGQIMKRGKLVVFGDVGQTFMYGAKGGEVYVLGNAAGRPLINAVGRPRVVINGTALDFLAESFMAGDPLNGGGFVIVNGLEFDHRGRVKMQATPYPGSNLFSLASGGAIYIRDPYRQVVDEQLNGGELVELSEADWQLILPYLQENERLFGISVKDHLLTVDGEVRPPQEVYRKIQAVKLAVLAKVEESGLEEFSWGETGKH
jgi:glutamate synthase domain-containing protein 1/glutamate synthase domain-containing protein 3|uniref:Glutamate synthase n=1 Tax=Desulfobacca acetoxidans TaxID=60893 RepID=A0A7C5EKU6_9BACT